MKSKMQNERIEILHVGGSGLKVMQIEKFLLGVKVALMWIYHHVGGFLRATWN